MVETKLTNYMAVYELHELDIIITNYMTIYGLHELDIIELTRILLMFQESTNEFDKLSQDFMTAIRLMLNVYNDPEYFNLCYGTTFTDKIKELTCYKNIPSALKNINEFFDIIKNTLPNEVMIKNENIINITNIKNIYCDKLSELMNKKN